MYASCDSGERRQLVTCEGQICAGEQTHHLSPPSLEMFRFPHLPEQARPQPFGKAVGQIFIRDRVPALPECAAVAQVKSPGRKQLLLQSPGSRGEVGIPDGSIVAFVISDLTNELGVSHLHLCTESTMHALAFNPAAPVDRCGRGSGNVEPRAAVHVLHQGCLTPPVVFVVLDDAKRVDPDVIDSEFPGDLYRIGKGSRQLLRRDPDRKCRDIVLE